VSDAPLSRDPWLTRSPWQVVRLTTPVAVWDLDVHLEKTGDVTVDPASVVTSFGEACNAHDLDAAAALCAPDIEFDGTTPPDGERISGIDALRKFWKPLFANPETRVDVEETITAEDRVVQRCRYTWGDGHVRAIDVYRVVDGLIVEKLSYVKG
jgi:hypothetical protein